MADDEEEIGIDPDMRKFAQATNVDKLPGLHGDIPDWFTDTDHIILHVMMFGHVLTPAIIAENSDRSRGAVSRRLKTLEAGGYVEKVDRGKYRITDDGAFAVTGDPFVYDSSEEEEK